MLSYAGIKQKGDLVFEFSLIFLFAALIFNFAHSLGMAVGPWGREDAFGLTLKLKDSYNVKENLCGCSPPGRNTGCGDGPGQQSRF
jgi:hypothetical protein